MAKGNHTAKGMQLGKQFRDALRMELAEANGQKDIRAIARRLILLTDSPQDMVALAAIKEIADRIDGKATQAIEHSGPDEGAIEVNVSSDARDRLARIIASEAAKLASPVTDDDGSAN